MPVTISFQRLYMTLLNIQEDSNSFMVISSLFGYEI